MKYIIIAAGTVALALLLFFVEQSSQRRDVQRYEQALYSWGVKLARNLDDIEELSQTTYPSRPEWKSEMVVAIDRIDARRRELSQMEPPRAARQSHGQLRSAMMACADGVGHWRSFLQAERRADADNARALLVECRSSLYLLGALR